MSEHQVVVIGAGTAGLATSAALKMRGANALVLDRADAVGGSWRGRYDRLKLNSSRWTTKLPGKVGKFDKDGGLYPSRLAVIAFLERYAAANDLDLRLGTNVDRLDQHGTGWMVRTSDADISATQV